MRPTHITCARCGLTAAVGQRGPVPAFCSANCRQPRPTSVQLHLIECLRCGTAALVRLRAVYCSGRCRNAWHHEASRADGRYEALLQQRRAQTAKQRAASAKPCRYCAGPMSNPRQIQCGAPDCKRRFDADRGRGWQREYMAKTGEWYGQANYAERQREYNRRVYQLRGSSRSRYPAAAAAGDARRRMLVSQATVERFAPRDVHERDRWTCGLCDGPVDPAVAWPDPLSASVDHIVPLSRGGAHALANVQCAHLGCNSSKGDREAATQAYVAGVGER